MIRLADVVQRYRHNLIRQYGHRLLPSHYRALDAIEQCRTSAIGQATWSCAKCQHRTCTPLSCGHRHCPTCQNHQSTQWLQRQLDKQLHANYFLLTFTLPAQLRQIVFQHQRDCYALLFRCAVDTLTGFAKQSERLTGQLGMSAVLHTHSRQLEYHPHIHVLLPAVGLSRTNEALHQCSGKYLFNVKALSKVFRAKCLDAFGKLGISLPAGVPTQWNVHCKPAGKGTGTLKYLSRYLYRGVISENNIISMNNGQVTYRYQSSSSGKYEIRSLPAATFLWKMMMHVLPLGLQRTRCYGFLHHNARVILQRIQLLLHTTIEIIDTATAEAKRPHCQFCHSVMQLISIWRPTMERMPAADTLASPPMR